MLIYKVGIGKTRERPLPSKFAGGVMVRDYLSLFFSKHTRQKYLICACNLYFFLYKIEGKNTLFLVLNWGNMEFETKRALLAYLGKNPNDNKLVDRLILRGEVVVEEGMYVLVDKDAIIEELKERVAELEGKITLLKESNWDLEELKVNCDYYKDLYEKECEANERRLKKIFDWIKGKVRGVNWDDFHTWAMDEEELPF